MTKVVTKVRKQLRKTLVEPDSEAIEALEATLQEVPDEVKEELCNHLSSIKRDIRNQRQRFMESEVRNGELQLESFLEYETARPNLRALISKKPTLRAARNNLSPETVQATDLVHHDTSSSGNKEADGVDEEEIGDLKTSSHEPSERLKALDNQTTSANFTSVQTEPSLAQARENESSNAKRMRLGLDPVSQPMPLIPKSETPPNNPKHEAISTENLASIAAISESKTQHPLHLNNNKPDSSNLAEVTELPPAFPTCSVSNSPLDGEAMSTAPTQRDAGPQPIPGSNQFPTPPLGTPGMLHNGHTDLSVKPSKPQPRKKLNPTEKAAMKQLIAGYRDLAAFVLRSVEELEQQLLEDP